MVADRRRVLLALDPAEDAERCGGVVVVAQSGEGECQARIGALGIVAEDGLEADIGHFDETQLSVGAHHDPALALVPEQDRLAVDQLDHHLVAHRLAGDVLELAVVEHVAVLEDLHERRATMIVGGPEDFHHVLAIEVVGPGNEAGLGTEGHGQRVERRVDRPHRGRLGDLADLRRR